MSNHNVQNRSQYLIEFAYNGGPFHGVQPQKDVPTVGGALKDLLTQAADEPPRALCFAARTDKGVHASHSIATCWFKHPFNADNFESELNRAQLPNGLLRLHARRVPYYIHARGSSRGKTYRYVVEDRCTEGTAHNPLAFQIAPPLDIARLRRAAEYLVGEHDYSSFQAANCQAGSTVKTIHRLHIHGPIVFADGRRQYHIDIFATAFLRKMIRLIAGTLVEIGTGLRRPEDINAILEAKDRQAAGILAPPNGLSLTRVLYELEKPKATKR